MGHDAPPPGPPTSALEPASPGLTLDDTSAASTGEALGSLFSAGWIGVAVAAAIWPVVWIVRRLRGKPGLDR